MDIDIEEASSLVHPQLVMEDLARIVNGTQPPYDDSDGDDGTLPLPGTSRATAAQTPTPRSTAGRSPRPRAAKKAKVVKEKKRDGEKNKIGLKTAGGDTTAGLESRDGKNEIASLKKELARKDRELERKKDEANLLRLKLEGVRKVVGSPLRCIYSQDDDGRGGK